MILNLPYIKCPKVVGPIKTDVIDILTINNCEDIASHCIKVAETCVKLAKRFNLNNEIAYQSGILHDVSAVIKPTDTLLYAKANDWYIDESEQKYNFILHQRISSVIAKERYKITDEKVLSAIGCHSTLKANASEYDMLLFLSDKISWDNEGTPPFLSVLEKGLDVSLAYASLEYITFTLENGMILSPHKWLLEAKQWLELICGL